MKSLKRWSVLLLLVSAAAAQTAPPPPSQNPTSVTAEEVRELRQALAAQQQQIAEQQKRIDELARRLEQDAAPNPPPSLGQVASTTPMIPAGSALSATVPEALPPTQSPAPQAAGSEQSPIAIRYKGITLTPGGFLAAETVWRRHATGGDVNTAFNSIPFSGAGQAHLSEFFGSGRQSRITLLGEGNLGHAKLAGYFETDWLSAGVTSNNNQSNSYTNRQRQIWGQASLNGWTFTGGQMWSLVTETKNGLDNRTETLPMTVDSQYHVGFSWARQFGFRVVKDFNDKVWLGFAVENPQTLLTAHGNANNFVVGGPGNGGGLYNATANYSFNAAPDFIFKAAFQPGWGHYEIVGIVSQFRDRVYPNATAATPSAVGAFNNSRVGGGFIVNARGTLHKHVDVGAHFMAGNGIGRYATSTLPDVTIRPDGTLALLHNYAGLGTLEWHSSKWDWYANAGAEYVSRYSLLNAKGLPVGYGSSLFNNSGCDTETVPAGGNGFAPGAAANCNGDTRNIVEGTFGFYYKFYNGPKGRLQWGPQFSYIVKNTWRGVGGAPNANEPMIETGLRYYLP